MTHASGDVTDRVAISGLKSVLVFAAAGIPTPPNQPVTIKYDVLDSVGNAADTKIRRVELFCPEDLLLCEREVGSDTFPNWRMP